MENYNVNKITEYLLKALAVLVVMGGMFYAGRCEYNDRVLVMIGEQTYRAISVKLDTDNQNRIVDEYVRNKEMWDSLYGGW